MFSFLLLLFPVALLLGLVVAISSCITVTRGLVWCGYEWVLLLSFFGFFCSSCCHVPILIVTVSCRDTGGVNGGNLFLYNGGERFGLVWLWVSVNVIVLWVHVASVKVVAVLVVWCGVMEVVLYFLALLTKVLFSGVVVSLWVVFLPTSLPKLLHFFL